MNTTIRAAGTFVRFSPLSEIDTSYHADPSETGLATAS